MLHCAFVRSPFAHARVARIDTSRAERAGGVQAVVTGTDAVRFTDRLPGTPPGFTDYCLVTDTARFVGEPVAAVAATSRYAAEDAVGLIEVEYEPLPPITDTELAQRPDAPLLYEARGTNVIFQRDFLFGDVDGAFGRAAVVVRDTFRSARVSANPMETNGFVARWLPLTNELTAWGTFQSPLHVLPAVCAMLRLPANRVRLVPQPYGGAFGSKNPTMRYLGALALLSRKCGGRPIKWIEDRFEHLRAGLSDALERQYQGELALTAEGVATGFRLRCVDDFGGWAQFAGMAVKPLSQLTGCYVIPACEYDITVVATTKNPQGAYRGYGPPPSTLVLEWLMDCAARELGLDPAEIRRRNFVPPDQFPYRLPTGNVYDSGNYGATLDALLRMSRYDERRRDQPAARREGRLVGLGLATTVEVGVPNTGNLGALLAGEARGTATPESAMVRLDDAGNVLAEVAFSWGGQGQTSFVTYLLADYFGISPERVAVRTVDSQSASPSDGPIGSRLAVALSGAVLGAAERVRQHLEQAAAVLLEADAADVDLHDGQLRVRGAPGRSLAVAEVAWTILHRPDLLSPELVRSPEARHVWSVSAQAPPDVDGRAETYLTAANAAHLAEVEVDPETGQVAITGYWIADDCGVRLNPLVVDGQIQGSFAQGLGMALLEAYAYDEHGERLSSSYMDYLLPTATEVPAAQKVALTTLSPFTPLGVKGTGEGALHTTPAALYCAVNDALSAVGAQVHELPMGPWQVWSAIIRARESAAADERSLA
jgi:CO/xanthine dehydrogenase Mo-binding subunit